MMSVGIAIITHNARHHLPSCLPPLLRSSVSPRILLMNSSSKDKTVEYAKELGIETCVIPRQAFNHGATREMARKILNTDIVVMVTPDAYAIDSEVIEKLISPLLSEEAVCAYARQIPHEGASIWASFPRSFNYPALGHIRSLQDISQYGIYSFFFSDSFGAYLNKALDEIGGFQNVLTGEDTVACAQLLRKGYKVAYVADAIVRHSHCYTLKQEFQRHFDTGLARNSYKDLLALEGGDSQRGKEFVIALFHYLIKQKKFHLLPYAFLQTASKWLGYQIGKKSEAAPRWFKRLLSSQDFYWNSS